MKFTFKRTNFGAACLGSFLCMVILFLITLYRDGGELHQESCFFFMNYLDTRPLPAIVMDPCRNDWGMYQARELSYFFDFLDTKFVVFLLQRRIIWFHSVCSLILCGMMIFCQQYFSRRFFPKVPGIMVTAFSLLFVLSPQVNALTYFRCAKYLTGLGLWGALFAGYAAFRRGTVRSKCCFLASLLLMVLSDRQGFFFAAAVCGTAGVLMLCFCFCGDHAPVLPRRLRFIAVGSFAVVLAGVLNDLYLTPAVIKALNGYAPDFSYQRDIVFEPKNISDGILFFFGNAGNLFSADTRRLMTTAFTGMFLAAGLALELFAEHRKGKRRAVPLALLWFCAAGASIVCAVGMAARHPAVMKPEVLYGTYAMPMTIFCFFLLTLTAAGGTKWFGRILTGLFFVAVAVRLDAEFNGSPFRSDSELFPGYQSGQNVLKKALRDPKFDDEKYCIPHRMELFLEFYRKNLLKNRK